MAESQLGIRHSRFGALRDNGNVVMVLSQLSDCLDLRPNDPLQENAKEETPNAGQRLTLRWVQGNLHLPFQLLGGPRCPIRAQTFQNDNVDNQRQRVLETLHGHRELVNARLHAGPPPTRQHVKLAPHPGDAPFHLPDSLPKASRLLLKIAHEVVIHHVPHHRRVRVVGEAVFERELGRLGRGAKRPQRERRFGDVVANPGRVFGRIVELVGKVRNGLCRLGDGYHGCCEPHDLHWEVLIETKAA